MAFIINILLTIGTAIWWVIQKFFPFLIKKFGLGTIKMAIQKTISVVVILVTVAFYGAVVVFISETYTIFRNFVAILNNPSASTLGGGSGSEYLSCFMNLLHASGIADGFNAAFSFGISVLIFFFLRGLYSITQKSLKVISDEVAKNLKLI